MTLGLTSNVMCGACVALRHDIIQTHQLACGHYNLSRRCLYGQDVYTANWLKEQQRKYMDEEGERWWNLQPKLWQLYIANTLIHSAFKTLYSNLGLRMSTGCLDINNLNCWIMHYGRKNLIIIRKIRQTNIPNLRIIIAILYSHEKLYF